MTGGQPVDGSSPFRRSRARSHAEGVRAHRRRDRRAGASIRRAPLAARRDVPSPRRAGRGAAASCARSPGVTVLIYDQTCAAEKRRRRKRGAYARPGEARLHQRGGLRRLRRLRRPVELRRVEPVETEFGRKRAIDQSTCNKDFSCVKGFCPSFVTVEGGSLRKATAERTPAATALARAAASRSCRRSTSAVRHPDHRHRRHRRRHHRRDPRHGGAYRGQGRHGAST